MKSFVLGITLLFTTAYSYTIQANEMDTVTIKTQSVAGDVYMLEGAGGNIGVLATPDGLLLVDDQFKPLADKIESAMQSIVDKPLKYIVNTHFHGDHTGSNSYFSHHAPIFAHHNVRKRLSSKSDHDHAALPVVTYENGITIHLSDETIELSHYPSGHTDGDTVVYFKKANVLHMGDLFFQGRFPFIDLNNGGSVKGYLANAKSILSTFPSTTKIIPGHGNLTDMNGLKDLIAMLEFSISRVEKAVANKLSLEQVIKQGIGEKYKSLDWNFITEEKWLTTLYTDLK
ncbi:MBL fold metallo-hydrolase [Pseudocolwellia agarivorans]|uniref:MBL fold metallo-hydrolase n=1 Tax=Pseudocolwellia agarivorans TaxID=1911682 RepID=UPI0009841B52|nr:MBL fold metallo-hydrolase [Pseudocolwellia agarivorans]